MKKVISLLLAIIMVTSVLTVNVSASTDSMTREEWRLQSKWKVPYQYQHYDIETQFQGVSFIEKDMGGYKKDKYGNLYLDTEGECCPVIMFAYIFSAMTGRAINAAEYSAAREAYNRPSDDLQGYLSGEGSYPSKYMARDMGFYIRQMYCEGYSCFNYCVGSLREQRFSHSKEEQPILYPSYEGEFNLKKDIDSILDNGGIVGARVEGSKKISPAGHFFVITEHLKDSDTYKIHLGRGGQNSCEELTFEELFGSAKGHSGNLSTNAIINLVYAYNPNISSVSYKSDVKIGEIQGDWPSKETGSSYDIKGKMLVNTTYSHLYGYLASVEYPNVSVVYTEGMDLEEENKNLEKETDSNNEGQAIYNLSKVYITSPKYGKEVEVRVEMYKIGENNYIKLRDVAYLLNESKNQFNVSWNGAENVVELTSFKAYEDYNKSELHTVHILKDNQNIKNNNDLGDKSYKLSDSPLRKDNELVKQVKYKNIEGKLVKTEIVGYNIEGANYYKLRDIGRLFNFDVDWKNNAIYIETDLPYTDD